MLQFIYFYIKDDCKLLPIGSFANDIQTFNAFSGKAVKGKLYGFYLQDLQDIEETINLDISKYIELAELSDICDYKDILYELNFAKFLCQYFYKITYEYQWANETGEKYVYVGIDCPNANIEDIID